MRAPPLAAPEAAARALRANRRGIRYMVVAMACFIANDTLVKLAGETMPAAQLIFVRGLMATAWVLIVARATGVALPFARLARGWVAGRATIDALATFAYLASLFHLPLANAAAINMAAPLFIAVLAGPMLGERIGAARRAAIVLGFAAVLMVIQPRAEGFNAWSLLCLGATLLHALRDLVVRRIPRDLPAIGITLATAVAVTLIAGVATAVQGWRPIDARGLALISTASVFLVGGYYWVIRSTREGEVSVVAPFRYSGLLLALAIGWVVWGELPNALGWAGIALLVATGLHLVRSEGRGR
ncbi:MAG TPA: DMT family transporter [Burkholderiaceae bacterium]|nr:DMT family transporter [Burkholderiaceae bacterium]